MPCVRAEVTKPVVSSAKGSVLYWWLNVAVPNTRGGRIEESSVRLPSTDAYGIGFCRVGNVLVVLGCSVGVVAIAMTLCSSRGIEGVSKARYRS